MAQHNHDIHADIVKMEIKRMNMKIIIPGIIAAIIILIFFLDLSFLVVTGTSMAPEITEKDVLIISPTDPASLKEGDIITYYHEVNGKTYMFTHRIVKIENNILKTKGDFLPAEDRYNVMFQDVKGVMVGKIPYLGVLPRFARTTAGYLLLILLPAFILITKEIIKIRRYS